MGLIVLECGITRSVLKLSSPHNASERCSDNRVALNDGADVVFLGHQANLYLEAPIIVLLLLMQSAAFTL